MRKLFSSNLSVPDCPKSVTRKIHLDARTLKPTKVYYSFFCLEGMRKVELLPNGYDKTTVVGCTGCAYKLAGAERG